MRIKKDKLMVNLNCIALASVAGTDIMFRATPDQNAPYTKFSFKSARAADNAMLAIVNGILDGVALLVFEKGE